MADRRVSPLRAASFTRPPGAIRLQPVPSPVISAAAPARALGPRPSPGPSPPTGRALKARRPHRSNPRPSRSFPSTRIDLTVRKLPTPPSRGDPARRRPQIARSRPQIRHCASIPTALTGRDSADAPKDRVPKPGRTLRRCVSPYPAAPWINPQAVTHPSRLRHGSGSHSPHRSHRPMTSRPSQVAPRPKPGPPPAGRPSQAAPRPKPRATARKPLPAHRAPQPDRRRRAPRPDLNRATTGRAPRPKPGRPHSSHPRRSAAGHRGKTRRITCQLRKTSNGASVRVA